MTDALTQETLSGVYEILRADLKVLISEDFETKTNVSRLHIKKVAAGPDAWCFASKHKHDDVTFLYAKDKEGNLLASNSKSSTDDLTEFYISFNEELSVNQEYQFTVEYKEPLDATCLARFWFVYQQWLILVPKAFGTRCEEMTLEIEFGGINAIGKCVPGTAQADGSTIRLTHRALKPLEIVTVSAVIEAGLMRKGVAIVLDKIFWTALGVGAGTVSSQIWT